MHDHNGHCLVEEVHCFKSVILPYFHQYCKCCAFFGNDVSPLFSAECTIGMIRGLSSVIRTYGAMS